MLHTTFEDLLSTFPGDRFVIAGDFNVDLARLGSDNPSAMQRSVADFFAKLGSCDFLTPSTGATFVGSTGTESCIDYVVLDQTITVIAEPSLHVYPRVSHRALSWEISVRLPCLGIFSNSYLKYF